MHLFIYLYLAGELSGVIYTCVCGIGYVSVMSLSDFLRVWFGLECAGGVYVTWGLGEMILLA